MLEPNMKKVELDFIAYNWLTSYLEVMVAANKKVKKGGDDNG